MGHNANHSLLSNTVDVVKWSKSIAGKFFSCVPGQTSGVVVCTIISQLSLTLSFFLPLKVIILLGSSGIPSYFPLSFHKVDKNELVVYLAILSGVFYLLHLCLRFIVNYLAQQGANLLVSKSSKGSLFANSEKVAELSYFQYSRALSGLVFILLTLVITWFIYPGLLVTVSVYLFAVYLVLHIGYALNKWMRLLLHDHLNTILTILSAIGFLVVFGFMVFDFLVASKPNVIQAVVGLLLTRQMLSRLSSAVLDMSSLFSKRNQVNALFFQNKQLVQNSVNDALWEILTKENREALIKNPLLELGHTKEENIIFNWFDRPVPGIYTFTAHLADSNRIYLCKLYHESEQYQAAAEQALSASHDRSELPIAKFLNSSRVSDYSLSIFNWSKTQEIELPEFKKSRLEVLANLASVSPANKLEKQFNRSKLSLSDRLEKNMLERLAVILACEQTQKRLDGLQQHLPTLRNALQKMKKQYVNKDISNFTLRRVTSDSQLLVTHWGRWTIEPLGSGWPVLEKEFDIVWDKYLSKSNDISGQDKQQIRLVALLYALELRYSQHLYVSAYNLIDEIVILVERILNDDGFYENNVVLAIH